MLSRIRFFVFRSRRKRFLKKGVFEPDSEFHTALLEMLYRVSALVIVSIALVVALSVVVAVIGGIAFVVYIFAELPFPSETVLILSSVISPILGLAAVIYSEHKKLNQRYNDEIKEIYSLVARNLLSIIKQKKVLPMTDDELSKLYLLCNERVLFLLNDIWINSGKFSLDSPFVKYEIAFLLGYIRYIIGTDEVSLDQMEYARKSNIDVYAILKKHSHIKDKKSQTDQKEKAGSSSTAKKVLKKAINKVKTKSENSTGVA